MIGEIKNRIALSIERLSRIFRLWKDQRFLRKHGCETWQQYHLRYDKDVNRIASNVVDWYAGYNYVYCFENINHTVYDWDIAYDGCFVINRWCEENLDDKYRLDFHRVYRHYQEWIISDLGGGDLVFAAFKNERDYLMFLLKWS